jgi:hypothetical protein
LGGERCEARGEAVGLEAREVGAVDLPSEDADARRGRGAGEVRERELDWEWCK